MLHVAGEIAGIAGDCDDPTQRRAACRLQWIAAVKHTVRFRPPSDPSESEAGPSSPPGRVAGELRVGGATREARAAVTTYAEPSEAPYRLSPPRVVVKVDSGVTWVRRAGESHLWRHAPDLCDCVLQTLSAVELEAEGDFDFVWLPVAARRADYILLFGQTTQSNARRLDRLGTRCEVVCCGSIGDARRVARILALGGDTVLSEGNALAVFSHWCCPQA